MKLSLAIALALAGSNAFALGLGTIQVKSGLNQPLDAEIPVLTESAAEATELTVDLASAEDFERVGLNRARLTVPLEMAVTTNARGQTVIKVTTKEAVREPLIDFLIVANWTKGKLLREYTVLLDPPITAPPARGSTATVAPVAEKPAPTPQPLAESKAPPKPARPEPKPPVAAAPQKPSKAAPPPTPAPAPSPKPAAHATGNEYGPVAQGETLTEIARATRPDEKTNINQMMLALLKANPKAFYQDNINALKRGAILRIPSSDDIKATGAVREAMAQVHSQNEAWMSKTPVTAPTLVAHTGAAAKTAEPAAAKSAKSETGAKQSQERLALVPPRAGKGDVGGDRAGAAGGTSKEAADVKAELARTKEALSSREQEAAELKSRVKQLEDLGSKDQRLISMKDSEIAELQAKLKELQAKTAASATAATTAKPAAETPAAPTAGKPEQKVTAKDIWGDMGAAEKSGATKPAPGTPAAATPTPSATTPTVASTTTPAAPAAATPAVPATTTAAAAATGATASSTSPTPSPGSTATAPATSAPAASTPTTPSADTGAATSKPAATAPAKSAPPAKIAPLEPASEPFYKNQNVLLGGGAALLLVGLLALMRFMRKPKPFTAGGMAEPEGDLGPDAGHQEEQLLDTLRQDPGNTAASLELLRHYYARGDAARFEDAAGQMHAHLMDPAAPEWEEVLAMGAVLAPHNPLFGEGAAAVGEGEHAHAEPHDEFEFTEPMHTQSGTFDERPMHTEAETRATEERFDYDLPVRAEETPPEVETLHHETLPDFSRPDLQVTEHATERPAEPGQEQTMAAPPADELFIGEDAIGTKLDLAKAYLDMGDPEGARSMLDEVLSEGNDSQKDEARKLLAEIK
ncbi:MAG TPA: FimV/HubP family polar landmark protein [Rudaea sp.]|nr:FimV/HubP family polar landmark protein [Rudaea sp.]